MRKIPRWLPGALISTVLVILIIKLVNWGDLIASVRRADYRILAVAFTLSFLWMLLRSKVWHTLLGGRASYRDVLFTEGEGYLLNNILPFRLGELGRAFLITRKSDLQFAEVLPTIVIERVVDLGFSAAFMLASIPYVVAAEGASRIAYIVGGVVFLGLLMMYVLARNNQWALNLFHKMSARWPFLQKFSGGLIESLLAGLRVLTDGWLFARFLFWMTLNWAVALLAYYLMTLAYFPEAQLSWGLFGLAAIAFGGAIPSLPGGIGTADTALTAALGLLTNDFSTSAAVALTVRLYNYLSSGIIGGIGLLREGETLGGIYRELMAFRKKDAPGENPPS